MSGAALDFEGVSVRYGDRVALRDVSLRTSPGEVVALAGPNGSGKSTLLRASVGLEETVAGRVALGGTPLSRLGLRARARRVAWMPQEEPLGDNLVAAEYVRYGRFPHLAPWSSESPSDREAVDRALVLAGADELRDRRVWELSGGERQRVRLARVLAQHAPLLLLDEPTAHLDIGHQLDVLERVRAIAREGPVAVVLALHDLNLAARFADRIVVLHRGRIVADGGPGRVLSSRLLLEVWGVASELRYDERSRLPYLIPRSVPTDPAPEPARRSASPRLHVMAGGGSGRELLGRLVDAGYSVSAGALPVFDSDTAAAEELRIPAVLEVPFAPISEQTRAQLRGFLTESQAVIVAAFPVGPTNLANLEELLAFGRAGDVLLLAQPVDRPWDYTGGRATEIRRMLLDRGAREVADPDSALRAMRERRPP